MNSVRLRRLIQELLSSGATIRLVVAQSSSFRMIDWMIERFHPCSPDRLDDPEKLQDPADFTVQLLPFGSVPRSGQTGQQAERISVKRIGHVPDSKGFQDPAKPGSRK